MGRGRMLKRTLKKWGWETLDSIPTLQYTKQWWGLVNLQVPWNALISHANVDSSLKTVLQGLMTHAIKWRSQRTRKTQATCYTKQRTETRLSVRHSLSLHICCRCRLLNCMSPKSIKSRTFDIWHSFPTRLLYATAAIIAASKRNVFWDVTPRGVETCKSFGAAYCLHRQTLCGMDSRLFRNASKFTVYSRI